MVVCCEVSTGCVVCGLVARAARTTMGKSTARLDAFTRGQIHGLRQAGKTRPDIQKLVKKKDGKRTTLRSIDRTLRKTREDPKGGQQRSDNLEKKESEGNVFFV